MSPSSSVSSSKIPIQSDEIEILKGKPFNEDLLDRKESVKILAGLIKNKIREKGVIAIDAAYGNGKTTFLKILHEYLLNENSPVVNFNAWENNFSDDPFTSLSEELFDRLGSLSEKQPNIVNIIEDLKKCQLGVSFSIYPTPMTSLTIMLKTQHRPNSYDENKKQLKEFKENLIKLSEELKCPIIVMIDELDRCRPLYAIKFLEIMKHFFSINGASIIFIIAINRSQLVHSIKALYGKDFDAHTYLKRFIDIDFQLPYAKYAKLEEFINKLIEIIGLRESLHVINNNNHMNRLDLDSILSQVKELLTTFFSYSELSLRQIQQSIYRLGLTFKSLDKNSPAFVMAAVTATLLRAIDENLYYKFYYNEITDLHLMNNLFDSFTKKRKIKHVEEFEAAIIKGYCEISKEESSPLEIKYREIISNNESTREERDYAQKLLDTLKRIREVTGGMLYFKESCKRIELLSDQLTPEQ